jgi:hypothetical protein
MDSMPKGLTSFILVSVGIFTFVQSAATKEKLFKNYVYQFPLANYTEAGDYYDCSEDIGGTVRCIDDVDFLEEKFTVALVFSGDKLIMVDQDLYGKAIAGFSKTFVRNI